MVFFDIVVILLTVGFFVLFASNYSNALSIIFLILAIPTLLFTCLVFYFRLRSRQHIHKVVSLYKWGRYAIYAFLIILLIISFFAIKHYVDQDIDNKVMEKYEEVKKQDELNNTHNADNFKVKTADLPKDPRRGLLIPIFLLGILYLVMLCMCSCFSRGYRSQSGYA